MVSCHIIPSTAAHLVVHGLPLTLWLHSTAPALQGKTPSASEMPSAMAVRQGGIITSLLVMFQVCRLHIAKHLWFQCFKDPFGCLCYQHLWECLSSEHDRNLRRSFLRRPRCYAQFALKFDRGGPHMRPNMSHSSKQFENHKKHLETGNHIHHLPINLLISSVGLVQIHTPIESQEPQHRPGSLLFSHQCSGKIWQSYPIKSYEP